MDKVTSSDGITIAFDRLGDGPPVIVVGGQLCDRALTRPTAEELAKHFTVFDYDRRGRGDSSDTAPYAVEREIEDVGALVTGAAGGRRRCTAIPPVLLSPSTQRRRVFPSPGSCSTSRPTTPTATRTGSVLRGRKPNTSRPCWQKTTHLHYRVQR